MKENTRKNEGRTTTLTMYQQYESVVLLPILDLGLCQTENILSGVGRSLTAADIQEIQATGSLVQGLFIAGRIAKLTAGILLNQSGGFGVVLLLADDLFHRANLLCKIIRDLIIHNGIQKSSKIFLNSKNSG